MSTALETQTNAPADEGAQYFPVDLNGVTPQKSASDPTRKHGTSLITATIAGLGIWGIVGGEAAVYFAARPSIKPWVPEGVEISTYRGFALVLLSVLMTFFAAWAAWAVRNDARRQALGANVAWALTGLAFLNLGWYQIDNLGYEPSDGTYQLITWVMQLSIGLAAFASVIYAISGVFKTALGEAGSTNSEPSRAAAWFMALLTTATLVTYWVIWFVK